MCERLREIPKMAPVTTQLFGIKTEVVRVSQQLLKQQLRLFQLTRTSQTFDVPERARRETALSSRQAVHLSAFDLITPYQRIFDQLFLDRFHRGKPHRVHWADEPHHGH